MQLNGKKSLNNWKPRVSRAGGSYEASTRCIFIKLNCDEVRLLTCFARLLTVGIFDEFNVFPPSLGHFSRAGKSYQAFSGANPEVDVKGCSHATINGVEGKQANSKQRLERML